MPGMGSGLSDNNPTIVAAFHRALYHQGLVVLLIVLLIAVAWNALRWAQIRRAGDPVVGGAIAYREPAARRLLRVSFGLIWIFDGVLQGQSSMPLGMGPQVIQPAAAASPTWVQHLDNVMATIWTYHPISAPAAAVWIQIGIGLWMLTASRGDLSRLAGVSSAVWGLVVWVFGEAFGQIFAPGLSWLFGAPGAVLLYCAAGVLVALPESAWRGPRLGRVILRTMGAFFVGMAVLQAWPGRGFWQGQRPATATAGTLTSMVQQMAQTPQPHALSSWVSSFAGFDAAHGWGVNLFAVVALAAIGGAFLAARPRIVKWAVVAGVLLCLADWVLIEDLGFLGGVGTDPNSMIPIALVFVAGYVALTRPCPAEAEVAATGRVRWRDVVADPVYAFRSVAALGAIGIALVGVVPMAAASTQDHADPILTQAIDGTPDVTNSPAPAFQLVDQLGRPLSLSSLRGKAVVVTFLDPVCTSDCPIIAQELRSADELLGSKSKDVEIVAVDANPRYNTPDYLAAFDDQEHLETVANWRYLTGTLRQLERVWGDYGVQVAYESGGGMIAHSDIVYVIDPAGHTRYVLDSDPGPATEATKSSFSVTVADAVDDALRSA